MISVSNIAHNSDGLLLKFIKNRGILFPHASIPYVRCGSRRLLYKVFKIYSGKIFLTLYSIPIDLAIFMEITFI